MTGTPTLGEQIATVRPDALEIGWAIVNSEPEGMLVPGRHLATAIARAIEAAGIVAAAQMRERAAQIALNARSEAALGRHTCLDPEGKACWLWAFDTANAIERDIRALPDMEADQR